MGTFLDRAGFKRGRDSQARFSIAVESAGRATVK
jgi:hypothetical protein